MAGQILSKIQHYLVEEGMDCASFGEEEGQPADRLLVYLGADSKKRERIIEITADQQLVPGQFKDFANMKVEEGCYRIQVQTQFPISFHPDTAGQMASAINFLNGMLEMPGLISDEGSDKVFYRTVQLVAEEDYKKILLIGVVGMHRMVLDMFSGVLERIGSGELSYLQLLDEVIKATHVMEAKQNG